MKVTLVKRKGGLFNVHVKTTRRGERRTPQKKGVPQGLLGEAIDEMVRKVRKDEPRGAPIEP